MTRENQLYIDHSNDDFLCLSCDRRFNTSEGVLSHCRSSRIHRGEWCERCEWLYVSSNSLQAHIQNSARHNLCEDCDLDFTTQEELDCHDVDAHFACIECNEYFKDEEDLERHDVDLHYKCVECDRFFSSWHSLTQVRRSSIL